MVAKTVASKKAKGRKFQQDIMKRISKAVGIKAGKDLDIDSRPMGQTGQDIILRGKAKKLFPFAPECKRTEKMSLYSWIKQAIKNTPKGINWIVFHKKNRTNSITIIDTEVFFKLYKELIELRRKSGKKN